MFSKIIESLFIVKIIASPTVLGIIVGLLLYLYLGDISGIIAGLSAVLLGILIGIFWVKSILKKQSASEFYSKTYATPDIDNVIK